MLRFAEASYHPSYHPSYHSVSSRPTPTPPTQRTQQAIQKQLQNMVSHQTSTISKTANNPWVKDAGTILETYAGKKLGDTKFGAKIATPAGAGVGIADNRFGPGIGATVVATYVVGTQEHALATANNNLLEYQAAKNIAHTVSHAVSNAVGSIKSGVENAVGRLEHLADPRTWMFH